MFAQKMKKKSVKRKTTTTTKKKMARKKQAEQLRYSTKSVMRYSDRKKHHGSPRMALLALAKATAVSLSDVLLRYGHQLTPPPQWRRFLCVPLNQGAFWLKLKNLLRMMHDEIASFSFSSLGLRLAAGMQPLAVFVAATPSAPVLLSWGNLQHPLRLRSQSPELLRCSHFRLLQRWCCLSE